MRRSGRYDSRDDGIPARNLDLFAVLHEREHASKVMLDFSDADSPHV
ncbi:MAG: hypothetical protein M3R44_03795 [Candidatus Eremiobacteraeota bacterium]|nr:hypothetical protein [Candidatus Eremiobacteraeota bacterium]